MLGMAGCAQSVPESGVYTPEELARMENYQIVEVLHAEQVTVDPETPGVVGGALGATAGGIIGSNVGGDSAIVALAALGAVIGYAIEQQATDTVATRYVVSVDGRHQVVVQKDSAEQLEPGDIAMLIGDYEPRLVKAPQEVIDAAQQNGSASYVKVDEETGVLLIDESTDSGTLLKPRSDSQVEPSGDVWIEPESGSWAEPQDQQ
jgi:outer membrane lipoprotein SlyB